MIGDDIKAAGAIIDDKGTPRPPIGKGYLSGSRFIDCDATNAF